MMNLKKTKYRLFGIIAVAFGLLMLLYVVYQYKIGAVAKDQSNYLVALGFLPVLIFVVFYSMVTGITYAKGQRISKEENKRLYYLSLSFWCVLLIADIFYLIYDFFVG